MRADYTYVRTNCIGGVNEQVEKAQLNECADARNVWVREGHVEQRPGYTGICSRAISPFSVNSVMDAVLISEDTATSPSVFVSQPLNDLDISGFDAFDRWYVGIESLAGMKGGFRLGITSANTNAVIAKAEYWNGTTWVFLHCTELQAPIGATFYELSRVYPHLNANANLQLYFIFAVPNDWATTVVDSNTKYFVRFSIENAGATELDAATVIQKTSTFGVIAGFDVIYPFVAKFPSSKRYLSVSPGINTYAFVIYETSSSLLRDDDAVFAGKKKAAVDAPPTMAVVPEFDEAYIAYSHEITVHKARPSVADNIFARVEASPEIVGPNAKYSTSFIAQMGEFPRATYITYFKGFLWAAGIEDDPHGIRWSAPGFAYKVWPLISRETLAENDNSKVTAIYGFGENMLVWKNDSMWQLQFIGTNAFGLAEFKPQRIPGAVGCVSQASVIEIHGRVYWLAEDGIYYFDGVQVKPAFKEKIQSVFSRITPSRRAFAVGVDWAPFNVYMLAVAVDGSDTNNLILVYDYNNKAWWLWDGLEVQFWLPDEDSSDNFVLYFGDSTGCIHELGKGLTDYGNAISAYVVTQPMGRLPVGNTKVLRTVSALSNNLARSVTLEALANDEPPGIAANQATKSYTDYNEVEYGEVTGTEHYVADRMRTKRSGFRKNCGHFQLKVSHSTKNTPWSLHAIEAGYEMKGRRR